MTIVESLCFLMGCIGATFYLNALTSGGWRHRLGFSFVAGGALGLCLEPWWPTFHAGSQFVLAVGMALVASIPILNELVIAFGIRKPEAPARPQLPADAQKTLEVLAMSHTPGEVAQCRLMAAAVLVRSGVKRPGVMVRGADDPHVPRFEAER